MEFNTKDYVRLVRSTASRFYRRYSSIRASHEFEDFVQELWIVWIKCTEGFDPSYGFRFTTYFVRACENHAYKLHKNSLRNVDASIEYYDSLGIGINSGSETGSLASPEDILAKQEHFKAVMDRADPRIQKLITLLMDTPDWLLAEGDALDAKKRYAKERGHDVRRENGVTIRALFDLIGVSKSRGHRMIGSIKETIDELNG